MTWLAPWVLPITALVAVAGTAIVVWLAVRVHRSTEPDTPILAKGDGFSMPCSVCLKQLVIPNAELIRLSGPEVALVVRSHNAVAGRALAEYICPYCEAAHCFAIDSTPPAWIGANLYEPQVATGVCQECRKQLRPPAWERFAYDGKINEAPDLNPDYGLVCGRCDAVCCAECVQRVSRVQSPDASFRCPRCGRGPVERFFHP